MIIKIVDHADGIVEITQGDGGQSFKFTLDDETKRDLTKGCLGMLASVLAGDKRGVTVGFEKVSRGVTGFVGMRSYREADDGPGTRSQWLVEAVQAAAEVIVQFPTEAAGADLDPSALLADGLLLAHFYNVESTYTTGAKFATRNIAPIARRAAESVRLVSDAIEPFLFKNPDLVRISQPIHHYINDPTDRAQETKKLVERRAEEITEKVTKQVEAKARQEGRDEAYKNITDRISTSGDDKK